MVYSIDEIRDIVIPIVKEYGVAKISLFGSYAKGKATDESDLDFIMDKGDLVGLQYFSLLNKLENAFNCKVNLITTGFSNKDFLNRIHNEEVLLYER
ncbi:nucleotidyltransferase family protein [Methanosphaera sp. BMS]|uniref:nucleotidyltransferase family protein n=1 Tax=Methanosphaera sp. BMS TaxID=1789762 RepID=UPI000DC1F574|nr:nucleotidyltransferase domain-containing protein [Methanosphaera sp. BMS]AWX33120.1 hypothetical protein AW729_08435 [Methanosphaera sp. BMS]